MTRECALLGSAIEAIGSTPLVSLARVAMGVHYISDVVAGAIVGVFVALIAFPLSPAIFNWISQLMMPFWGLGLW